MPLLDLYCACATRPRLCAGEMLRMRTAMQSKSGHNYKPECDSFCHTPLKVLIGDAATSQTKCLQSFGGLSTLLLLRLQSDLTGQEKYSIDIKLESPALLQIMS